MSFHWHNFVAQLPQPLFDEVFEDDVVRARVEPVFGAVEDRSFIYGMFPERNPSQIVVVQVWLRLPVISQDTLRSTGGRPTLHHGTSWSSPRRGGGCRSTRIPTVRSIIRPPCVGSY